MTPFLSVLPGNFISNILGLMYSPSLFTLTLTLWLSLKLLDPSCHSDPAISDSVHFAKVQDNLSIVNSATYSSSCCQCHCLQTTHHLRFFFYHLLCVLLITLVIKSCTTLTYFSAFLTFSCSTTFSI